MALDYQEDGKLVPGVHEVTWDEFVNEYGYNSHRADLIVGLRKALDDLKSVGCKRVYIDGSFVSKKNHPNDYDSCWEYAGVDLAMLKANFPLFFDFDNGRLNQKNYYRGELFPATSPAKLRPLTYYIDFFQRDRENNLKGIIALTL
jgi:hypothetical protein